MALTTPQQTGIQKINNSIIEVGFNMDMGGSFCFFREMTGPVTADVFLHAAPYTEHGQIIFDVYGNPYTGGEVNPYGWPWNPTQSGSTPLEYNRPVVDVLASSIDATTAYIKTAPTLYDFPLQEDRDAEIPAVVSMSMEMWVELEDHHVKIRYKATFIDPYESYGPNASGDLTLHLEPPGFGNNGGDFGFVGEWAQEAPIMNSNSTLFGQKAVLGTGGEPTVVEPTWFYGNTTPIPGYYYPISSTSLAGKGGWLILPDNWMAIQNNDLTWGWGVYNPTADAWQVIDWGDHKFNMFMPTQVFGFCSPAVKAASYPADSRKGDTYDYTIYLTAGAAEDIRERFQSIAPVNIASRLANISGKRISGKRLVR